MSNNKIYIIIAGSRNFNNYFYLSREVSKVIAENNLLPEDIVIVSGTAMGADKLGERYAMDNSIDLDQHPADWSKGKSAGMIRNREMACISQMSIIFWDGVSPGSKGMYDISTEKKLKTYLYEMPKTLIGRLDRAKSVIEAAYNNDDLDKLSKCSKNFTDLYTECYSLWVENKFSKDIIEYYQAEYLKYLLMYCIGKQFDYNNSLYSLTTIIKNNASAGKIMSIV